jgi:hypothetical protein
MDRGRPNEGPWQSRETTPELVWRWADYQAETRKSTLEHFPIGLNRVDFGGFPSACEWANLVH